MYQFEYLAKERQNDLRREADRERLLASALRIAGKRNSSITASTLRWTGKRLSSWGDQLQKEYANDVR